MQPLVSLVTNEAGVDVLRIAPKPGVPAPASAPKTPCDYPLTDDSEAHLIRVLLRSTQPVKTQSSLVVYSGSLDEPKRADVLQTVARINSKLLSLAGTGIVADAVGPDAFTFSLRHDTGMWGDMAENAQFRAAREYTAPVPKPAAPSHAPRATTAELPFALSSGGATHAAVVQPVIRSKPERAPSVRPQPPLVVAVDSPALPDMAAQLVGYTRAPARSLGKRTTNNMPVFDVQYDGATGETTLSVRGKRHHGKATAVSVKMPKSSLSGLLHTLAMQPEAVADSSKLPLMAIRRDQLVEQLAQLNQGLAASGVQVLLCGGTSSQGGWMRPRIKFAIDENKWGAVPGDVAMPRLESQQLLPGMQMGEAERAASAARIRQRRARRAAVAAAAAARGPKPSYSAPPLLQFIIDADALKVFVDTVEIDVTGRQVQLLQALGDNTCVMSSTVFLHQIGDPNTREGAAAVRGELRVLDQLLVAAANRTAPKRPVCKVIAHGSDIRRKPGFAFTMRDAA